MMTGLHIFSTAPGIRKRAGKPFSLPAFEVVCQVLSALMWKRLNGPIKFYGDKVACRWLGGLGLLDLYDAVDDEVLESIPADINQDIFWAGAKLFALQAEKAPVAMVDTDLIIWKPLGDLLDGPLTVLHREDLIDCYIPKEFLKTRPGYAFDPQWDWTVHPCNTAFAYFGDEDFKNRYVEKAVDFMRGNGEYPMEMVSQMVFAEQRLLAMESVKEGLEIHTLVGDPFENGNDIFTHLWGAKNIARNDQKQCRALVNALMNKIKVEDSSMYEKLRKLV